MPIFEINTRHRTLLLIFAVIGLIGPNAMFLYYWITEPALLQEANANPIALAFMIEAMMLLGIFLVYVWIKTQSAIQVLLYFVLTFAGSLAFSFPLFFYLKSKSS